MSRYLTLSHAGGLKPSPSLQITVTMRHVDNPARGVKFRRHNNSIAVNIRERNRRDERENTDGGR
jgi:hypothetical protein